MTTKMNLFIHSPTPIQTQQPTTPSRPSSATVPLFQVTPASLYPSPASSSLASTTSSSLSLPFVLTRQPAVTTLPLSLSFLQQPSSSPPPTSGLPVAGTSTSYASLEATLQQQAIANDEAASIPFKIWRSRHMAKDFDDNDHDNIPIDAPLPSTKREKYHRSQLRAIQLQRYQDWYLREGRQQRRQQRFGCSGGNDDDDEDGVGRRVRFTLPSKLKRSHSSSFSDSD